MVIICSRYVEHILTYMFVCYKHLIGKCFQISLKTKMEWIESKEKCLNSLKKHGRDFRQILFFRLL